MTPKNEFFHLFLTVGLLERLSATLVNLSSPHLVIVEEDTDIDGETCLEKVAGIFKVFSTGDSDVKGRICSKYVLTSELQHHKNHEIYSPICVFRYKNCTPTDEPKIKSYFDGFPLASKSVI